MATLKVYSREYGVRKVQEKVKFNFLEKRPLNFSLPLESLTFILILQNKSGLNHKCAVLATSLWVKLALKIHLIFEPHFSCIEKIFK